ncbi:Peroxisome chaperone and import receptor [Ascosphaera aggregata]|nr:Peroxisome chaperone and import receptor [Ascosphaera aggregata]
MAQHIETEGPFEAVVKEQNAEHASTSPQVPTGQSIQDQLRAINEAVNSGSTHLKEEEKRQAETGSTPAAATEQAKETSIEKNAEHSKEAIVQGGEGGGDDDYEDDDDDLDELDDMLDSFAPTKQVPRPAFKGPDRASSSSKDKDPAATILGHGDDFDEEEFIKHLEAGMAELMFGGAAQGGDSSAKTGTMGDVPSSSDGGAGGGGAAAAQQEMSDWEAITKQMSEDPNTAELMKMLMGEGPSQTGVVEKQTPSTTRSTTETATATTNSTSNKEKNHSKPATASSPSGTPMNAGKPEESFQDIIRKTMERMRESGDRATAAAAEDADGDMLTQVLKAMESGIGSGLASGDGDKDGSLDKMLMGLMEQMTNKDILYDPMSELNAKFGPWLKENKGMVEESEYKRFEAQAAIVKEIVDKFEEKGYSDEKSEDRAFIWEKMQKMQATGGPPEDLVANPFAGEDAGLGEAFKNGAEEPGCPQQ